ncbi:MAG: tRNA 2-thiouridine(34) synthase MnmA [Candidatus Paceibacterota bacterium]
MSKKVLVGLSGGVDSSVSAYLLKKQGYEVIGAFIKVWEPPADWGLPCTWRQDRRDAMRVAAHLAIPFITVDLSREYEEAVVNYLISEYQAGRTPNPDVMCNKEIKFGAFYQRALAGGIDFIATGHYARNENNQLKTGLDKEKDQSYFLWNLTGEQLKHIIFPLGSYQKVEVRKLAAKAGLMTAEKKDSQGICFLGKLDMAEFLKKYLPVKPGVVVDETGRAIGQHDGAVFYTLGQRHGFTVTVKTNNNQPYYIADKDLDKNILVVSHNLKKIPSNKTEAVLKDVNWISGEPQTDQTYQARIRYRQTPASCRLRKSKAGDSWTVKFDASQAVLPPGQSLVVYDGDICLGGGVII